MHTPLIVLAALLFALSAQPQSLRDVDARLANIPQDQRPCGRYRYWLTTQPVAVQRGGDSIGNYRAWLQSQGVPQAEIDSQARAIEGHEREMEVQRWNRVLTAEKPSFNSNPNLFLVKMAKDRKPGTALDVGLGQGRNTIWLAQQGWDATGFDPADKAIALAQETARHANVRIKTEVTTDEAFDWGQNRWDLILLSYAGGRGLQEKIERALKPAGVLIVEAFHRDATRGNSIGGRVVFDTGELPALFPNLRVVHYEEPLAVAAFVQQRIDLALRARRPRASRDAQICRIRPRPPVTPTERAHPCRALTAPRWTRVRMCVGPFDQK